MAFTSHDPWQHPYCLKDSKWRVRERYWHPLPLHDASLEHDDGGIRARIIPCLAWRQQLGLLFALLMTEYKNDGRLPLQWYLLESVTELLDWRNQSPCLDNDSRSEAAGPHERNRLQRLISDRRVEALCDLSIRNNEEDEWDMLDYEHQSIPDRSRNALLRAARMLAGSSKAPVWILCTGSEERFEAEEGIRCISVRDLLDYLLEEQLVSYNQFETLVELQRACDEAYQRRNAPPGVANTISVQADDVTVEYLSDEQVAQGLRAGTLLRGRLNVEHQNPREAFVTVDKTKYFIDGRRGHFNRALNQDTVILEVLPESQWGRPVGRRRLMRYSNTDEDQGGTSSRDDDLKNISPVPSARVVALMEPARRVYVATLIDVLTNDEAAVLVVPMDVKIPKIRLVSRNWRQWVDKRLLVEIDGWELTSNYPHGRCIEILGLIGDLETEISSLLHENQVALEPFSVAARACLPPQGDAFTIPESEICQRRDLRTSHQIFSVDPPGCQDIDDTMHAKRLPNGDLEVGVHIADVTYFVKHNSALDREAAARGTTFYLVDRRFDMLPSLLSSNLCSLHEGVDRLAVSVIWVLSSDLEEIKSSWYGRTVIHNCAAMTYDQADRILKDEAPDAPAKSPPPPLTAGAPVQASLIPSLKDALGVLTQLARQLKEKRESIGGAVDLSSGDIGNELKFTMDSDGNPVQVKGKEDKEIHHTIAEMMILANSYVANKIYESFPDTALLRVHRSVEEERFEDLKAVLDAGGVSFDWKSNMALANSLKNAQNLHSSGSVVNSLFRSLATRAMSEAQYVCTGDDRHGVDLSHYGLGLEQYTHFTSPIRRYADVVVHKQLLESLFERPAGATADQAEKQQIRPLDHVPASNVISILEGEDISQDDDVDGDYLVDSLIEGASGLALDQVTAAPAADSSTAKSDHYPPTRLYGTSELSKICQRLNVHNRLAKQSSSECQKLFLSLYFRHHVEIARGVVVDLRSNGFLVFVPKFDIRGPIYLTDMEGNILLDPQLFSLPPTAGLNPSKSLSESSSRLFSGQCKLVDEKLEVSVSESSVPLSFRTLDVVTVKVSCELWDAKARVPSLRFELLAGGAEIFPSPVSQQACEAPAETRITSRFLEERASEPVDNDKTPEHTSCHLSLATALSDADILSSLDHLPRRSYAGGRRQELSCRDAVFSGRIVYSNFVNPDTRSAGQEAAQQAAAAEAAKRRIRASAQVARRNEYDSTKAIERATISRQQRLANEKRNTRRSKAK